MERLKIEKYFNCTSRLYWLVYLTQVTTLITILCPCLF